MSISEVPISYFHVSSRTHQQTCSNQWPQHKLIQLTRLRCCLAFHHTLYCANMTLSASLLKICVRTRQCLQVKQEQYELTYKVHEMQVYMCQEKWPAQALFLSQGLALFAAIIFSPDRLHALGLPCHHHEYQWN